MGSSNISGIGKIFAQVQNAEMNDATSREDLEIAFTDVMSRMTVSTGTDLLAGKELADTEKLQTTTESAASDREYDRYQYHDRTIKEKQRPDWNENDKVSETLDSYADDVKEVLKEELGVSEEQIQEAMETLGLAFVDLMEPKQLVALVAELTGTEDASALLLSSEFMTVMQNVGELSANLLRELGVSAEELTQLLETSQNADTVEMPQNADVMEAPENTDAVETLQNPVVEQTAEQMSEQTVPQTADDSVTMQKETVPQEVRLEEETAEGRDDSDLALTKGQKEPKESKEDALEMQTEEPEEDVQMKQPEAGKNQAALSDGRSFEHPQNGNGDSVLVGQGVAEKGYVQVAESTEGFSSQLDVSNIIRQIVEFSKVTLNNTATTMEMQLNPEHLGKIYLEITSKEGVVSARITAQNEAVKEALESQIVELKQNMNQAGVKVEAVEVAVGSHEFEKNLEQNAKQEERQTEEQEKAKQTRRINLSELDELSGLMSEEESLVAQIMADQGNSIDFTA